MALFPEGFEVGCSIFVECWPYVAKPRVHMHTPTLPLTDTSPGNPRGQDTGLQCQGIQRSWEEGMGNWGGGGQQEEEQDKRQEQRQQKEQRLGEEGEPQLPSVSPACIFLSSCPGRL